jgi:hypothetical protein
MIESFLPSPERIRSKSQQLDSRQDYHMQLRGTITTCQAGRYKAIVRCLPLVLLALL